MANNSTRAKPGQPTKYDPAMCVQAKKLCLLGAIDKDLADFFEISIATLNNWKSNHPEFLASLKEGKDIADAVIAESLFNRGKGYSHPDVHISNYQGDITVTEITKHYPPDTTACIFWLKNRQKELWRDVRDHMHGNKDGKPIEVADATDLEVARRLAYFLQLAAESEEEPHATH